jgi:hypothetical protein
VAETNEARDARDSEEGRKRRYVRPQIAWEEEYKPAAFGISCAKQVGNLGCLTGPFQN